MTTSSSNPTTSNTSTNPLLPAQQSIYLCVGNEAGDMDSIVSSIATAFLLNRKYSSNKKFIPILPFPREELNLRKDVLVLFTQAGFTQSHYGMLWDIEILSHINMGGIILTDANTCGDHIMQRIKLPLFPQDINHVVAGIIDHHTDEGQFLQTKDDLIRIVQPGIGSACTLVALELKKTLQTNNSIIPPVLKRLLYGTIIMDTRHFKPEKTNQLDMDACAFLSSDNNNDSFFDNPKQLFKQLDEARGDVSTFSCMDLFKIDFKQAKLALDGNMVHTIGFSSIPVTNQDSRIISPHTTNETLKFIHDRKLDLFIKLFKENNGRRGIELFSSSDNKWSKDTQQHIITTFNNKSLFPSQFTTDPLFIQQGIVQHGFGYEPTTLTTTAQQQQQQPSLSFNASYGTIHGSITRKTLLPFIMEILKKVR
jgi:exopolyphosphatase